MKFAFVLDPLESLKARKDSSILLMRAAAKAGDSVFAVPHDSPAIESSAPTFSAIHLELHDDDSNWFSVLEQKRRRADFFDAIFMRKDPPVDAEFIAALHILQLAEQSGVPVFNAPRALLELNEKISAFRFPDLIPPSLVSRDKESLLAFHRKMEGAVFKPLDGRGGQGIFVSPKGDKNCNAIIETLSQNGRRMIIAQQYLPAIADEGDRRVLIIDGEPAPFMLARIPRDDDHRANLDAGGEGRAMPLGNAERKIAEIVAPFLADAGVILAGLDVIGGKLTEINITSPTCLREILDQTNYNAADLVIAAARRQCKIAGG